MALEKEAIMFADGEFCQSLYRSASEVLGEDELHALLVSSTLNLARDDHLVWKSISIDQLDCFLISLKEKYGLINTRGISQLIGRAVFRHLRRSNQTIQQIGSMQNRLQPFSQRIFLGLQSYIEFLKKHLLIPISLNEEVPGWQIIFNVDLQPNSLRELNAISYFLKGMFEEFLEWMDVHRNIKIEELDYLKESHVARGFRIYVLPTE